MTPARAAAVSLDGVSRQFGPVKALQGITGTLHAGELTGLVGPDGAGKTTLMRLMAGLLRADAGQLRVAGLDPASEGEALADRVGYMPQRFGLYEELSVAENLRLYAELRGIDAAHHDSLFAQLLSFTRLAPFTERRAGQLSGGMKQKLGLACAIMARPQVLLLDEPGVGVDPVSRQDLWRMVQALTDEGMAVVWATAYLDEAERCQRVLLLNEGQLLFAGAPGELTAGLQGRTLRVAVPGTDRRALLREALDLPSVGDGVIQGAALRLVLRADAADDDLRRLLARHHAQASAAPPRFEDAFVDLLGGGPGGTSPLAARLTDKATPSPKDEATTPVVECVHLTRRFGDFVATDDVGFAVQAGEIFGLLGPNGAGKSTTFKMLCGLLRPSSGRALVAGHDLASAGEAAKRQLGYMAQKFSLYGLLSVTQNLAFSAGVYGLTGATKAERIAEMIEVFHLAPYLSRSPDALPLGIKQRLALACALMHRPRVLFLDEPTSGVDPTTRREFWTHINGLVQTGVTVMVTTHFMDEAEYCDRVALMVRGRLIALDAPDALKAAVAEPGEQPSMEAAFIRFIEREDRADSAMAATT
ncbi:MAG: ABC transporter ATP-binding protein [Hydrogenophaga sp.]|uniref:ATP-binding cassette domain-containing protein n=1 Tax=Hydrogenophaga sp. TaxID=1904254 RepID=UPI001DDE4068|nr:ATP-binding cassette domain-containing protein [Hydrogenophaga sp.]MBX3609609.1 ABC transporter ATP-binding protein [Hydrogenophaga sp.]